MGWGRDLDLCIHLMCGWLPKRAIEGLLCEWDTDGGFKLDLDMVGFVDLMGVGYFMFNVVFILIEVYDYYYD
jgi:hypothetical protein